MKRTFLLLHLAISAPLLLAGCIEANHPTDVKDAKSLEEIDLVLAARRDLVKNMNADLSMSAEGLEHDGSMTAYIFCERPDRFRMDGSKRMGPNIFTFIMSGDRFIMHLHIDGKYVRGSVKGQERKHPELAAAFAWLDQRLELGDSREIEESTADHVTIVTKRGGKVARREWLQARTLFATRLVLFGADGAESATVEMSDYREVKQPEARPGPSAWIPWKITVGGRTDEGKVYTLKTSMVRAYVNDGLDPATFNMDIPEGAEVEEAK